MALADEHGDPQDRKVAEEPERPSTPEDSSLSTSFHTLISQMRNLVWIVFASPGHPAASGELGIKVRCA